MHVGSPLTRDKLMVVLPQPGRDPVAPGFNLLMPDAQAQQIVPLDDPIVITLSATRGAPQEGPDKVEAVIQAYTLARQKENTQTRP